MDGQWSFADSYGSDSPDLSYHRGDDVFGELGQPLVAVANGTVFSIGWNRLGGNLIISGAFGLFDREAMMRSGGYMHGTAGEDVELVARPPRQPYESGTPGTIRSIPDPVAGPE